MQDPWGVIWDRIIEKTVDKLILDPALITNLLLVEVPTDFLEEGRISFYIGDKKLESTVWLPYSFFNLREEDLEFLIEFSGSRYSHGHWGYYKELRWLAERRAWEVGSEFEGNPEEASLYIVAAIFLKNKGREATLDGIRRLVKSEELSKSGLTVLASELLSSLRPFPDTVQLMYLEDILFSVMGSGILSGNSKTFESIMSKISFRAFLTKTFEFKGRLEDLKRRKVVDALIKITSISDLISTFLTGSSATDLLVEMIKDPQIKWLLSVGLALIGILDP